MAFFDQNSLSTPISRATTTCFVINGQEQGPQPEALLMGFEYDPKTGQWTDTYQDKTQPESLQIGAGVSLKTDKMGRPPWRRSSTGGRTRLLSSARQS